MRDIIVNVPKSQIEHFWEDVNPNYFEFWNLSKKPKDLAPGDNIYFGINNEIIGKAKVHGIYEGDSSCESTNRKYSGCQVYWKASDFEKIKKPVKKSIPSRGFSYVK